MLVAKDGIFVYEDGIFVYDFELNKSFEDKKLLLFEPLVEKLVPNDGVFVNAEFENKLLPVFFE